MYVVNSDADEPIMLLDKHIGYDESDGMGIDGALFQQELLWLDSLGKKRIQVWINSPGGSVAEGYNIYNAIVKSKTPADTYCFGIAASMAAVIFQAGRKRVMADYGILMYHNPFGGESTDLVESMRKSICTMVSARSGKSCEEIENIMNRDTFIMADEAVSMGMADTIEVSSDYNKKRLSPATVANSTKGYWRESGKILNNIFKKPSMIKVTSKLNLNEAATEDAIASAIDAVLNRASKAESILDVADKKSKEDMEKKDAEMKKMKDDLDAAEDNFKKTKDAYDALKKEKDDADEETKTKDAKNMISGFVKLGAIKNDAATIAEWEATAKADLIKTKNMLEGIPINKKAEKIGESLDSSVPKYTFGASMINIHNKTAVKG